MRIFHDRNKFHTLRLRSWEVRIGCPDQRPSVQSALA
jgi:hypothetical protein